MGARPDHADLVQATRVIEARRTVGLRLRRCIQLEIGTTLLFKARRR
jgi:hypothetical protein